MKQIVCLVSLANVMKQPAHHAELHTQFLYGDRATLIERSGSHWIKVMSNSKQSTGWVLSSQFEEIPDQDSGSDDQYIVFKHAAIANQNTERRFVTGTFISRKDSDEIAKDILLDLSSKTPDEATCRTILFSFLNAPYMWGGVSVLGIDCSGFAKIFYRFFHIRLPHLASAQIAFGELVDFLPNVKCGDLAFFENDLKEITHVGILLNEREIIHCSESNGRVMVDLIDQEGIISKKSGKRTHQLRLIKRLCEVSQ